MKPVEGESLVSWALNGAWGHGEQGNSAWIPERLPGAAKR
jgi:hypothetical protein